MKTNLRHITSHEKYDESMLYSAFRNQNIYNSTEELENELEESRKNCEFSATKVPFSRLDNWKFDKQGNLRHETGKFFSIEGLEVYNKETEERMQQAIIVQPEIGILGILTRKIDNVLYFLMQFKIEPGNLDNVQISPTVQATKSNYTGVHKGKSIPYLEYFMEDRVHKYFDQLESEQATRFLAKNNSNIIVEFKDDEEIEVLPQFKWFTLGQLIEFMKKDNVINMNTRSILSAITFNQTNEISTYEEGAELYRALNPNSNTMRGEALFISMLNSNKTCHKLENIKKWIDEKKSKSCLERKLIPIHELLEWHTNENEIAPHSKEGFRIVGLDIKAGNREVTAWTQPIVEDYKVTINGFLMKRIDGVMHLLVKLIEEPGSKKGCEVGPTVQGLAMEQITDNKISNYFYNVESEKVIHSSFQSDEGGRFLEVQHKHLIIEIEEDIEEDTTFKWLTIYQIKNLIKEACYVNIEARSLLACIDCREV